MSLQRHHNSCYNPWFFHAAFFLSFEPSKVRQYPYELLGGFPVAKLHLQRLAEIMQTQSRITAFKTNSSDTHFLFRMISIETTLIFSPASDMAHRSPHEWCQMRASLSESCFTFLQWTLSFQFRGHSVCVRHERDILDIGTLDQGTLTVTTDGNF